MISEKINQLPQHIRDYIHDLESMCPADLVQENAFLKESIEALLRKGRKMSDTITQECKCCETDGDCINGLCMSCAEFTHNLERHYDEARRKLSSIKKQYAADLVQINQFYFPKPVCKNQPPEITNGCNACLSCPMRRTCLLIFEKN